MTRPRRSVLYLPASNPRALHKARSLPADVLIFDLEDAVAPARKAQARAQLCEALASGGYGERELIVRINGAGTPWHAADIAAVARCAVHGVCLPKIESADAVLSAERQLSDGGLAAGAGLWVMAETPAGVLNIRDVAAASGRIEAIVMGTSDLTVDLRARHTPGREPLLFALAQCVMAARERGCDVIDGVHLDLGDADGLMAACRQGRDLGFDGKSLIHPQQIAAANTVFSPAAEELRVAAERVAAWERAEAAGQGVVLVDGKLVEQLHVDEAQRLLAQAEAIARLSK